MRGIRICLFILAIGGTVLPAHVQVMSTATSTSPFAASTAYIAAVVSTLSTLSTEIPALCATPAPPAALAAAQYSMAISRTYDNGGQRHAAKCRHLNVQRMHPRCALCCSVGYKSGPLCCADSQSTGHRGRHSGDATAPRGEFLPFRHSCRVQLL
eukprot:CAMPEP_0119316482 /NCGR_PEP_ID=MMETSP1333-20130426/39760_1 /TAXON_ID=418940 /ORGANISM="Scyphosphaera apsteinii, Strain RCC1455" /LENGTH=154 /DNA_ID=CAMNT_0007322137 /DNA_START=133 /DNA_END=597 /DNA_ORIENTATION=-